MKYVGVENSLFKKQMCQKWKSGDISTINTNLLVAKDCVRHLEILKLFDKIGSCSGKAFKQTLYYHYQKSNDKSHKSIMLKIKNFFNLYVSIREHGYDYSKGYIKVTTNGARIDGSHRASILAHIKISEIRVVLIDWRKFFTNKQIRPFLKHLRDQKKLFGE